METIINLLKKNGVGVLPTDTIYGIVGSAYSKVALNKIYKLKSRDENKPFIILINNIKDLESFGVESIKINWPAKTTIILPVENKFIKKFQYLHRGTNALAFRLITNKLERNKNLFNVIKKVGPIVAPSANPQSLTPAKNITEAKKYFGESVDFYLDEGTRVSKPSKIISYVDGKKVVIRK